MDGEAGWWTTSGNIGLPPLARAMGVGRQQHVCHHDGVGHIKTEIVTHAHFDNLFSLMKFVTFPAKTICEIEYDPGLVKCKQKLGDATERINVRVAY